jgi:cellulose synthase/poly-beta-1,6-N-acetylglucosamine synthase-like glycosyltransferase
VDGVRVVIMWWLILPVIIYSSGLLVLWLIFVRRSHGASRGDEGLTQPDDAAGASEPAALPKVSVVVAVRNEERHITTLLGSLVKQDYPDDLLEIIIVNDNSTDRTPIAVSEFIRSQNDPDCPRMKLIYNPFSGKKRAVRHGIEKASGEVILTTDADCTVGSEWVRRHASWYINGGPDLVLAPVVQRPAAGFWHRFGVFEFSALQAVTEAAASAGYPVMCNAANMSFRREIYIRYSGELREDLPSGDDMFLLEAVMRGGGAARHDGRSAAAVETAGAVTSAALLRQRARWASKAIHLRSTCTLTLAAATAACNAAVTAAAVTACVTGAYAPVVAAMYTIKAIPDYLLIAGEMKKQGNRPGIVSFILAELIYPFYFMTVWGLSLFPASRRFRER